MKERKKEKRRLCEAMEEEGYEMERREEDEKPLTIPV